MPHLRQSIKVVAVGLVVDVAGSLVMTLGIGLVALLALSLRGLSPREINEQFWSPATQAFCSAGGLLMTLAGGYVAATIARRAPLWHAMVVGLGSMGIAAIGTADLAEPLGLNAALLLAAATVPTAVLGGYLALPAEKLAKVAGN